VNDIQSRKYWLHNCNSTQERINFVIQELENIIDNNMIGETITETATVSVQQTSNTSYIVDEHHHQKQEAAMQEQQQLGEKENFRYDFWAKSLSAKSEISLNILTSWIKKNEIKVPRFYKAVLTIFPLVSVVLIVLLSLNIISVSVFTIWFFAGLGITGYFIKTINSFYSEIGQVANIFDYVGVIINVMFSGHL